MPDRTRERIGPFVVTTARNLDPETVVCANCGKGLARVNKQSIDPSPEALLDAGAVAWPNFGWFCSVECERAYSQEFHISCAQREAAGGADNRPVAADRAAGWFSRIRKRFRRGPGHGRERPVTGGASPKARIYWWRIRALRQDLADAPPPGAAQVVYLTVFLVLEIFSWGLDTELFGFAGNNNRSYWLSAGLALVAVKLCGPVASYLACRPADPSRFTDRFIALSCPIRLRVLVFLLTALLPLWFVTRMVEAILHLPKGGLFQGSEIGFFWLAFNL